MLFLATFIGIIIGFTIRSLIKWHKHDYKVAFSASYLDAQKYGINFSPTYTKTYSPSLGKYITKEVYADNVTVIYSKCSCGKCKFKVSDGSTTELKFDEEHLRILIETYLAKKKEQDDKELIDKMNSRLMLVDVPSFSNNKPLVTN